MKHRGNNIALMAAGILIGTVLSGPAVQAAEDLIARRSDQKIYVDGASVELEAYNINGSNYVKLRDVGAAVNFEVYWDGAAVQIDSGAPYTGAAPVSMGKEVIEAQPMPESDDSAAVPREVFTGAYTEEAYNAARAALRGDTGVVRFNATADKQKYENMLAEMANGTTLSLRWIADGTYEVYAHSVDWSAADEATEAFIQETRRLATDQEKVILANDWLCDHAVYNPKAFATVNRIASSSAPVEANCASFACAMNHLCARLGIPCIQVCGESHAWNAVYADNTWTYVDASLNDQVSGHDALLFAGAARKTLDDPAGARFLKELLVPVSTR